MFEILKIAEKGNSKTKIMYNAYLSYAQMKAYLEVMLRNGLLEKKGVEYKTTKRGLEFMHHYENMGSMLEAIQAER